MAEQGLGEMAKWQKLYKGREIVQSYGRQRFERTLHIEVDASKGRMTLIDCKTKDKEIVYMQ